MKNGIFTLLFIAAMSTALFCGCTAPSGNGTTVSGTGNVVYNNFEGGFYGIVASDGVQYYPLNLPGRHIMGTAFPVTFTGTIETGVVTTVQWGTPDPPDLDHSGPAHRSRPDLDLSLWRRA